MLDLTFKNLIFMSFFLVGDRTGWGRVFDVKVKVGVRTNISSGQGRVGGRVHSTEAGSGMGTHPIPVPLPSLMVTAWSCLSITIPPRIILLN